MEDIKKAIEELKTKAIRDQYGYYNYSSDPTYAYREGFESGLNKGTQIILSKWQEATRWRKVEEELPEITPDEPYFINVKTDDNNIETLCIEEGTNCIDKLYRHYK